MSPPAKVMVTLRSSGVAAGSTTWIEFPVWISSDLRSTAFTWTFQAVF